MRLLEILQNGFRGFVALFRVPLPEEDIRLGLGMGAAFNAAGMPMQLMILRTSPEVPRWPIYLSIAAGLTLLVGEMTMSGRLKGKVSLITGGELGTATAKALAEQGATFNSLRA